MSLVVGVGQLGFALGSMLAGFTYAHAGFRSSTALSAGFLLVTAWVVWRFLPEPALHVPATLVATTPEISQRSGT